MFFHKNKNDPKWVDVSKKRIDKFPFFLWLFVAPGLLWVSLSFLENIYNYFALSSGPNAHSLYHEQLCSKPDGDELKEKLFNMLVDEKLCSSLAECRTKYSIKLGCYQNGRAGEIYGIDNLNINEKMWKILAENFVQTPSNKILQLTIYSTTPENTVFPLLWDSSTLVLKTKLQRR